MELYQFFPFPLLPTLMSFWQADGSRVCTRTVIELDGKNHYDWILVVSVTLNPRTIDTTSLFSYPFEISEN